MAIAATTLKVEQAVRRIKESKDSTLNLAGFQLNDNELYQIFQAYAPFVSKLKTLNLHNNQLTKLPVSLLLNLEALQISENKLICLPELIAELDNLKALCIDENQFRNSLENLDFEKVNVFMWSKENMLPLSAFLAKIKESNYVKERIRLAKATAIASSKLKETEQKVAEYERKLEQKQKIYAEKFAKIGRAKQEIAQLKATSNAEEKKLKKLSKELEELNEKRSEYTALQKNEAARISCEIEELSKLINLKEETYEHLKTLVDWLIKWSEISIMIVFIGFVWSWGIIQAIYDWNNFEPLYFVIITTLLLLSSVLSKALNQKIWKWFHEGLRKKYEKAVCYITGFDIKEYERLNSRLEGLKSDLTRAENDLKNYLEEKILSRSENTQPQGTSQI